MTAEVLPCWIISDRTRKKSAAPMTTATTPTTNVGNPGRPSIRRSSRGGAGMSTIASLPLTIATPSPRTQVEIKARRQRQQNVAGDRHRVVPLCAADQYEHGGHHHADYREYIRSSPAQALTLLRYRLYDSPVYQFDTNLTDA